MALIVIVPPSAQQPLSGDHSEDARPSVAIQPAAPIYIGLSYEQALAAMRGSEGEPAIATEAFEDEELTLVFIPQDASESYQEALAVMCRPRVEPESLMLPTFLGSRGADFIEYGRFGKSEGSNNPRMAFNGFEDRKYRVYCEEKKPFFSSYYIEMKTDDGKTRWVNKESLLKRFSKPEDFERLCNSLPEDLKAKVLDAFAEKLGISPEYATIPLQRRIFLALHTEISLPAWLSISSDEHKWMAGHHTWGFFHWGNHDAIRTRHDIFKDLRKELRATHKQGQHVLPDAITMHRKRNEVDEKYSKDVEFHFQPAGDFDPREHLDMCSPEVLKAMGQGDAALQEAMKTKKAQDWATGVLMWRIFNPHIPLPWDGIPVEGIGAEERRKLMLGRMVNPPFGLKFQGMEDLETEKVFRKLLPLPTPRPRAGGMQVPLEAFQFVQAGLGAVLSAIFR